MNVLLVNPYITDFTAYDLWLRPLGLLYIASVIETFTDCRVFWLDLLDRFAPDAPDTRFHDHGRGKFHREIIEKPAVYRPVPRHYSRYGLPLERFNRRLEQLPEMDFIFMTSLMTYWHEGVDFTLNRLKQRFPGATTVLGGILPTLAPDAVRETTGFDHFVSGPGEYWVLDFLARRGARVHARPHPREIDSIPHPAWHLLANPRILPLLTSRGCPFRCRYCASRLLNPVFRQRSVSGIVRELRKMQRLHSPSDVVIFDDALLVDKQRRFLSVFEHGAASYGYRFHTPNGLHAGEIDRLTAETLFNSGFETVRLGFESTTATILRDSDWKVSTRAMKNAVLNLERAGYDRRSLETYLLFGYPSQTVEDIRTALNFTADLGVVPRLSFFSPVPGTAEYRELLLNGTLSTPPDLYETNKTFFVYTRSGMTPDDIQRLKEETSRITGHG